MPYCPKCGNQVDENMTFCPRCGASLKAAAATPGPVPTAPAPPPMYGRRDEKAEKNEKQEKNQNQEKGEKGEKGEQGFIGFLIGGLILIVVGAFALLQLTNNFLSTGNNWAIMLLLIGVIIIGGAVYIATQARKRSPQTT